MNCNYTRLTKKQKSDVETECKKEFAKLLDQYNTEVALQILCILRFDYGFGQQRLHEFCKKLNAMQKEITEWYSVGGEDIAFVCKEKLKQSGIDIEKVLGD